MNILIYLGPRYTVYIGTYICLNDSNKLVKKCKKNYKFTIEVNNYYHYYTSMSMHLYYKLE